MSKEVLYRAVSKKGKWIYGFYYCHKGLNEHFILPIDETPFYNGIPIIPKAISDYEVYKETVSEFTGLTDKNGTKIFEGDIVYDSYREYSYQVKYWLGQGMYFLDKINDRDGNWYSFEDVDFDENIEVIGNIHDNPELLEEV